MKIIFKIQTIENLEYFLIGIDIYKVKYIYMLMFINIYENNFKNLNNKSWGLVNKFSY